MSRACPCILSDAAGMPELIEHKWLHKPGDAEKLAKLIDSMCNSNKNMEDAAKKNKRLCSESFDISEKCFS